MAAFGAKFNAAQLTIAPLLAWLELVELVAGYRREVEVHQLNVTCDGFTPAALQASPFSTNLALAITAVTVPP